MGRSTQAGPGEESPVVPNTLAPGTLAPGKTAEEIPQAAEPAPDGASPPGGVGDGPRDFSGRRPGRGNRLRRGLRSRRKSFRQS